MKIEALPNQNTLSTLEVTRDNELYIGNSAYQIMDSNSNLNMKYARIVDDSKLFLLRFPEEARMMKMNKFRIKGFLKYTIRNYRYVGSLEPPAAKQIVKLNRYGFVTIDSQEGLHTETKNPTESCDEERLGEPLTVDGSKVILEVYSERAYCDGFIRNEILHQFTQFLKAQNRNLEVIEHPYNGSLIVLTTQNFQCEDGNNHDNIFTGIYPDDHDEVEWTNSRLSSESYYSGPYMDTLPIDRTKWTWISTIDMDYGNHALGRNGLFRCIERALIASLTQEPIDQIVKF